MTSVLSFKLQEEKKRERERENKTKQKQKQLLLLIRSFGKVELLQIHSFKSDINNSKYLLFSEALPLLTTPHMLRKIGMGTVCYG